MNRVHFPPKRGPDPRIYTGKVSALRNSLVKRRPQQKKSRKYIRENADVRRRPNLMIRQFCNWINEDLLSNETLEPGFPRKISPETGRKWMHKLGFNVVSKKKGTFVDSHEREDVVAYRTTMVSLGFLNPDNAPTDEAKNALPSDLGPPPAEVIEKTVVLFHDETFQAKEDQPTLRAEKGTSVMCLNSRGCGIMVSDFISENHGYL